MGDDRIARVVAWEALDSRGSPTLGCSVTLGDASHGQAVVPSGASTGNHDAQERRDQSWHGHGLRQSVAAMRRTYGPQLIGLRPHEVDAWIDDVDPTPELSHFGVHAALGLSVAARRAEAAARGVPLHQLLSGDAQPRLPRPMVNVLSGGAHVGSDAGLTIQDVLVIPLQAASFREAIERAWTVRRAAAAVADERGLPTGLVADEGGLGLPLSSPAEGLELITRAIERAGLEPGVDAAIAVDIAANQLWDGRGYRLNHEGPRLTTEEIIDAVADWTARFAVISVEDPLHDGDWDGWSAITARLGELQVVGDDLFSTSADRVATGAAKGAANAVLVKPNQRGTLTRAEAAVEAARHAGYATVVSARSGDTEDDWLADLAVGWAASQIKVGSTTRSERTAKWNRLLQIEAEALGDGQ